jgi:hypothetical protein
LKGTKVRVKYKSGSMRIGIVIAESDECVGVRFEDAPDVPVIVRKSQVGVVLT